MALPDLVASITAKTDGFESALNRSAKAAEDASARIKESTDKISIGFDALKGVVAGLGASVSVGAFVNLVKGAIDAADHLNDLSKKTGIAVETLGGLGFAAQQSGSTLDAAASGFTKLNRSIAEAGVGNKLALQGFDAIGVSVKDAAGNLKTADRVFAEIADRFASYEDGPNKAALAIRLFGKAGADLIPLLDEGGASLLRNIEYYERYSAVTTDLAQKADQFNDTLAKVSLLQGAFGKTLAAELLPTLQTLANLLVESKEKGTAFAAAAEGIGAVFNKLVAFAADVVFVFKGVGTEIGAVAAQLNALLHLDFKGFSAIGDAVKDDAKRARTELDRFKFDLSHAADQSKATLSGGTFDQQGTSGVRSGKTAAPALPSTNRPARAAPVDDPSKKILDQQLKELDIYIAREKELLSERDSFLQIYYQRDELSIEDYFQGRTNARNAELAAVRGFYQQQIDAENAYIASLKATDPRRESKTVEAKTKIIEITEKLRKAEGDAVTQSTKDWLAQDTAMQKYRDSLVQLQGQLDAIRGRSSNTDGALFDIQHESERKKIDANLGSNDPNTRAEAEQAKETLGYLRQQALVTASLSDVEKQRSLILGDLQNAQNAVNDAVYAGRKTEIEGLVELSAANKARIADLTRVVEALDRVAQSSQDPFDKIKADAARVELQKLADQTDLLGDKFREIGKTATDNLFDNIKSGTMSAKDVLKSFVKDIDKMFFDLGKKALSQYLFGKNGPLGGFDISKITEQLSGAAQNTSGATSKAVEVAASVASTAANDEAFKSLTGAVSDATTSLSTLTTDGFGGLLNSVSSYLEKQILGTAVEAAATDATSSAAASLAVVATAADAASSALFKVGVSGSSGGGGSFDIEELIASFSAKGNIFSGGNVVPFAKGGVVDRPTVFPMRTGAGLMGEAGPEAVMPLRRTRDGRLGVSMDGGSQTVVVNQYFPIPAGTNGATQLQAANAAARGLRRAQARGG